MKSIVVTLPNGCFVYANMAGIVRVNDELVLRVREKQKSPKIQMNKNIKRRKPKNTLKVKPPHHQPA